MCDGARCMRASVRESTSRLIAASLVHSYSHALYVHVLVSRASLRSRVPVSVLLLEGVCLCLRWLYWRVVTALLE